MINSIKFYYFQHRNNSVQALDNQNKNKEKTSQYEEGPSNDLLGMEK